MTRHALLRPLALALVALLALHIPPAAEAATRVASDPVQVTALAVAEDDLGTFVGVSATVTAQVLDEGSGQVFVATKPLAQTDMQGSARLASRVAAHTLGLDWTRYDYLVTFTSDSTVIGGPSAGGVMALALTAALHGLDDPASAWRLDPEVAATGTINPDGTIGPVGGIPAKAEGAARAGLETFLYPAGLDVATTQVEGRVVTVNMADHCASLGITCQPAATLADLLRVAAGVDVSIPDQAIPDTGDYAAVLTGSVTAQVADLRTRAEAARDDPRLAGLTAQERARIVGELDLAEERLAAADQALAGGEYYLAATRAFQGAISAGRAELLTTFYGDGRTRASVDAAVADCQRQADAASALADPLEADALTALYAVGAAQTRALQAQELAAQAERQAQTTLVEAAIEALFTAAFCTERARTVAWWADLRDAFPAGPAIADLPSLARDAVDEARDMVAYAQAVLGEAEAQEAATLLAGAQAQIDARRFSAAAVGAVEAQTSASVAMQTVGTLGVPAAVLEAARQSAARAIAEARNAGIEPMLSVSLVELAQDQQDTATALGNLWTARSLALLDQAQPAVEPRVTRVPLTGDAQRMALAVVAGAVIGAGLLAALVLAVSASRRR